MKKSGIEHADNGVNVLRARTVFDIKEIPSTKSEIDRLIKFSQMIINLVGNMNGTGKERRNKIKSNLAGDKCGQITFSKSLIL